MALDVNNVTVLIRKAGAGKVRVIPMPGQNVLDGDHQIEINENGAWSTIAIGVKKPIAEHMVSSALNRVICG